MTKTTPLDDETYAKLKETQKTLYDKYHIRVSIQNIIRLTLLNPDEMTTKIIKTMKGD